MEEIYKAQRERDQAVMARLRLANEERDEALLRAKKLHEAVLEYGVILFYIILIHATHLATLPSLSRR